MLVIFVIFYSWLKSNQGCQLHTALLKFVICNNILAATHLTQVSHKAYCTLFKLFKNIYIGYNNCSLFWNYRLETKKAEGINLYYIMFVATVVWVVLKSPNSVPIVLGLWAILNKNKNPQNRLISFVYLHHLVARSMR